MLDNSDFKEKWKQDNDSGLFSWSSGGSESQTLPAEVC